MKKTKTRVMIKILKIIGWAFTAIILFFVGLILGVVGILSPQRLTPIVEHVATNSLQNARVTIDNVELTIIKSFPFVHVQIDNLNILSTVTNHLDENIKEYLPVQTDSVFSIKKFSGGINLMKLPVNTIELSDVVIVTPKANLVVINDTLTNFDILVPSPEPSQPFDWKDLPQISFKKFVIEDPGKIHFFNVQTATEISASFTQVSLEGASAPMYRMDFDGSIVPPSELLDLINIPDIKFGLNGSLDWNQKTPYLLEIHDFDFLLSIFGGRINTILDFNDGFRVNTLDVNLLPIDINNVLGIIPPHVSKEYGLPSADKFKTDAKINMALICNSPWNVGSDTIPPFSVKLSVPPSHFKGFDFETLSPLGFDMTVNLTRDWVLTKSLPDVSLSFKTNHSSLKWHRLQLKEFVADISARLPFGDINKFFVNINQLELQGPSTDLKIKGKISDIVNDPMADLTLEGSMDISKLPPPVKNAINGTVAGNIKADVTFKGSKSMFTPENFHRAYINGDVSLSNFYWIAGDTINMFETKRADLHFGSTEKASDSQGNVRADSLFRISLKMDSGYVVHDDLTMDIKGFNLSLAAQNKSESFTKGRIIPMGGNLSLGSFFMVKTNDTTVVRLRDVKGTTVIKAYNNNIRTPQFLLNLNIGRASTGNKDTRLVINNAHADINAFRVAKSKAAKRFTQIADSIHYAHPTLPPDSVAFYALQIHNRHRSKYPRVHPLYEKQDSVEILDWGASPLFKRLLNLWTFSGTLSSKRASLFTPMLPLRNRVRNIDVKFNNDSLVITNLQYKIGHSDFTINGVMSNMRKAFTSSSARQPLKVNFEMLSDTIDVNQLYETYAAGVAYSERHSAHDKFNISAIDEDEEEMERRIAEMTQDAPDSLMPLLIPENVDAQFAIKSNHVEYSDFDLKDMTGKILMYNGAVNLQNIGAKSEVGTLNLSALYSGLRADDLRFGFGLRLNDFNIHRFLTLVPAIDSIMPMMRNFGGIISTEIAATADIDNRMNIVLPSLDAAITISGDSLVLLDPDTFKHLSKWLLFKHKDRNIIDHMTVQMIVKDNQIDVYPFIFDFDRYRLGVQGYNDFNLNFNYHIAVLKSPIPFKFGINLSGNPDKFKIRLGGAKFGEKQIRAVSIVDTTRINLMNEIENVFRRGARNARLSRLRTDTTPLAAEIDLNADSLTHADSLRYIQEGLIEGFTPEPAASTRKKEKKSKNAKANNNKNVNRSYFPFAVTIVATIPSRRRRRKAL